MALLDLNRAVTALGQSLLEFVCNCSVDQMPTHQPAVATISDINNVLSTKVDGRTDVDGMTRYLRYRLGEMVDGKSLVLRLYERSGGVVRRPPATDDGERLIVELAAQAYGLFLLPPDTDVSIPGRAGLEAGRFLFGSSVAKEFQQYVMKGADLAGIFSEHSESTGHSTPMIYRSTGRGGSVQLWALADMVLQSAWQQYLDRSGNSIDLFCEISLHRWRSVRKALLGKLRNTQGRFAFSGVRLPDSGPYRFGGLTIRESRESEHQRARPVIEGQLSSADASGNSIIIDYAGNVVVEATVPYVSLTRQENLEEPLQEWPAQIVPFDIDHVSRRLRMGLLLAVASQHRVQMVMSWYSVDDPLDNGMSAGYGEPQRAVGLVPTQLTDDDIRAWQKWYTLLAADGSDRLDIAISRVLRAISERRDHTDVLIDSVIAWENVFGSSQGEPTLRVTGCMARLLASDPGERARLRTELAGMYALRSKAVHGNSQIKASDAARCYKALDYAIDVLRIVYRDRSDLLEEKDGNARSIKILME